MNVLPLPGPKSNQPSANQPPTVAIALFIGFILSAAFVALVAVVIPGVLLMVVAGMGLIVCFVLQYFLWGRWLYPIVMKMEADSDAQISVVAVSSATTTPKSER